ETARARSGSVRPGRSRSAATRTSRPSSRERARPPPRAGATAPGSAAATAVATFSWGADQAAATGGYDRTWLAGADVVITPLEAVRLWLAYGQYDLDAQDRSDHDRTLHYATPARV